MHNHKNTFWDFKDLSDTQVLHCSQAPAEWKLSEFLDERNLPVNLFDPKGFLMEQNRRYDFVMDLEKSKKLDAEREGKVAAGGEGGEGEQGQSASRLGCDAAAVDAEAADGAGGPRWLRRGGRARQQAFVRRERGAGARVRGAA